MQVRKDEFYAVAVELMEALKKDIEKYTDGCGELEVKDSDVNHLLKVTAKMTKILANAKRPNYAYEAVVFDGEGISGFWVQKVGTLSPNACVYMDKREGPVVGVRAMLRDPLAAALSVEQKTGAGQLTLVSADGDYLCLTGNKLRDLLKLLD